MTRGFIQRVSASISIVGLLLACAPTETTKTTHWLELEIVDWMGRPFRALELTLFQDAGSQSVVLDESGRWSRHDLTEPGPAMLVLPNLRLHAEKRPSSAPDVFEPRADDISISWNGEHVRLDPLDRHYRLVAKAVRPGFSQ